jgi:Domain of unknown function (DUF5047)
VTVQYVAVGAATDTTVQVVAVVSSSSSVRVAYSTNANMSGALYTVAVTPTAHTVYATPANTTEYTARVTISGLSPDTRYHFRVEHAAVLNTTYPAQARTFPVSNTAASFVLGVSGDAGLTPTTPGTGSVLAANRLSNHTIFADLKARAVAEDWVMFAHLGDLHYGDPGKDPGNESIPSGAAGYTPEVHRRLISDVFRQGNQHLLYRSVSTLFLPDDHDRGPNNHDGTFLGGANYEQVYRERLPSYFLSDPNGVWHSTLIGRVLVVATDCRGDRDPNTDVDDPNKTMLGDAQVTWLEDQFTNTTAEAIIWLMPNQWLRTGGEDTWAVFSFERDYLAQLVIDRGWDKKLVMVNADRHAIKMMQTQPWGGWPVMVAAPLDASGGSPVTDYPDGLGDDPGSSHSQYGTVSVDDNGDRIQITMTTWRGTDAIASSSITVAVSAPSVSVPGALARTLTGSHRVVYEARLITEYQTSADPDGDKIPILDGDIQLDGTANLRGTLAITTEGKWPRRATDLLSPYGNEIFIRAGVDTGSELLWVPLGFYRIDDPEQDDAPNGPIRIGASDRMSSIEDSKLTSPRDFGNGVTVGAMFSSLVNEIYPNAVIIFDDDTGSTPLGRSIVVEEDRLAALKDVASSFGKICFWDGQGFLRVMSAPDENEPVWEVNAGRNGVLIKSSRRMTRKGVFNGVVATGEGTDDQAPVYAIAVDDGATSPTRWGGRFGKVPTTYSSPLITTTEQALTAAEAKLRRSLGAPYSADFGSITNPALQPYDPVRVTHSDGSREVHVLERLTIPLTADAHMTASTREKTQVVVRGL